MADKLNPVVTIVLDKERHLKLTLSAMIAFKRETGKDLLDSAAVKRLAEGVELEDMRAMLWACLRHEDKELTVEQTGDLIHLGNMAEVVAKLGEAWGAAVPEAKKENGPLVPTPPG